MLLIAAFAWLFIGSLIIFHQEHVLGKHIKLNSHLFISPKSKDKQGFSVKLIKPVQKLYENGSLAGLVSQNKYSCPKRVISEIGSKESFPVIPDDIFLYNLPLRAPPTI